jgi:hypothetical protein
VSDETKQGYKHPPKSGQFKPGRSGNPRGRPKGTRNLKIDLDKLLRKRVRVRENGEIREISRQEAMLLSLFNKAVQGSDVRAANAIVAMVLKLNPPEPADEAPEEVTDSDRAIIEDYFNRRARNSPE